MSAVAPAITRPPIPLTLVEPGDESPPDWDLRNISARGRLRAAYRSDPDDCAVAIRVSLHPDGHHASILFDRIDGDSWTEAGDLWLDADLVRPIFDKLQAGRDGR